LFRVSKRFSYNDHWWPPSCDDSLSGLLLQQLQKNPEAFLSQLTGKTVTSNVQDKADENESDLPSIVCKAWEKGKKAPLENIYRLWQVRGPTDYYHFLYGLCLELHIKSVLEIGTDYGGSILTMRTAINDDAKRLVTVDLTAKSDAQLTEYPDIIKIQGDATSREVIEKIVSKHTSPIDLLFIDTAHDFKTTMDAWGVFTALLRPRVIVFDDITLNEEMKSVWRIMVTKYGKRAIDATSVIPDIRTHSKKPGFGLILS
jgi:predicted O-methyltransferase YrrM